MSALSEQSKPALGTVQALRTKFSDTATEATAVAATTYAKVKDVTAEDVQAYGKEAVSTFKGYLSELKEALLHPPPYDHYVPPFPKGLVYSTAVICIGAFIVNLLIILPAFAQLTSIEALSLQSTHATSLIAPLLADYSGRLILLFGVNGVFFCCASLGCLMIMQALVIRRKFIDKTIDSSFEASQLYEKPKRQDMYREMWYLSGPHVLSICGLCMGITFFLVMTIYSLIVAHTSGAASYLWIPSVVLLGAMIYIRIYVKEGTEELYANLKSESELIKGTGKGAVTSLVYFAIGMLLLDAPLFVAPLEYSYDCGVYGTIFQTACTGFGLPPVLEAQLVVILEAVFFWTKIFYVPICFVGLTAIVGTLQLGAWVGPDESRPCCSVKSHYKSALKKAIDAGTYEQFHKTRVRNGYLLQTLNIGVLIGVCVLIPIYTVVYIGVKGAKDSCDLVTASAQYVPALTQGAVEFVDDATPVVEFAKAIATSVMAGDLTAPMGERLNALSQDVAFMDKVYAIDLKPACDGAASFLSSVDCSAYLPTAALVLSSYPFTATNTSAAYTAALEPACAKFDAYVAELNTFCASGRTTLSVAPTALKQSVLEASKSAFETADAALGFVFANTSASYLPKYVIGLNMTYYKELAVGIDSIDYTAFYPTSCEAIQGIHFWVLAMFTGLFLHLPPAICAWMLVSRYGMIMRRQEKEVLTASPLSGKGKEMI